MIWKIMLQQQFAARRVRYPDVSIISENYKQMESLVVDEMKPISSAVLFCKTDKSCFMSFPVSIKVFT